MSSAQRPDTLTVAFVITASDLARGKDQLGALVANIPDGVSHRIPLECLRRFALVQHALWAWPGPTIPEQAPATARPGADHECRPFPQRCRR